MLVFKGRCKIQLKSSFYTFTVLMQIHCDEHKKGLPRKTFFAAGLSQTVCWDSPTWWTPDKDSAEGGNTDQTSVGQNQDGWKSRPSFHSPDRGQRDCQCLSNLFSAPKASGSSPSWLSFPGAAPPLQTRLPEQLQQQPDKRDYRRKAAHTELAETARTLLCPDETQKDKHTSFSVASCAFSKLFNITLTGNETLTSNWASCCPHCCTSAVPEIHMSCWVMFAQAL